MDFEKGSAQTPQMSRVDKQKRSRFFVMLCVGFLAITCAIPVMFGMGVVGAVYGMFFGTCCFHGLRQTDEVIANLHFLHRLNETVDFRSSDQVHNIARHLESSGGSYPISYVPNS